MVDVTDPAAGSTTVVDPPDYDKLAEALRSRVDWLGKALAAIATLGTSVISLKAVNDLAPGTMDGGSSWVYSLAALGFLLLAGGCAVRVAVKLMQVNQPVVLDTDPTTADEFGAQASADVQRIYRTVALQNGFTTLSGLQSEVQALRAIAVDASTDEERKRRSALADELQTTVDRAVSRARWSVVRRNAAQAAGGREAMQMYLGVLIGLLGFAYCADIATDPEQDDIATAKACAEARSAGALEDNLKGSACETPAPSGSATPTASSTPLPNAVAQRASLSQALTKLLDDCASMVPTSTPTPSNAVTIDDCAKIAQVAGQIYPSPTP